MDNAYSDDDIEAMLAQLPQNVVLTEGDFINGAEPGCLYSGSKEHPSQLRCHTRINNFGMISADVH